MSNVILVVDDEKTIRWSLGEALRESGYEVIDADSPILLTMMPS